MSDDQDGCEWVPAHLGSPGQGLSNGCVCVCVCVYIIGSQKHCIHKSLCSINMTSLDT